jgi:hypothetical protein
MSDIRDWYRDREGNSASSPDGFPELMARSGLNDSNREMMSSVKKFHDDFTYRRIFETWGTHVRVDGENFNIVDGTDAEEQDATGLLSVGQRIRMVDAGSTWTGHITVIGAYGASKVTITVAWLDPPSPDTAGPTTAPDYIELGPKEMGTATFRDHGTADAEVPLNSDLDAHVTTAESSLDVGFVDGQTREEMVMAAARGRLNPNGGMDHWQRGTTFTAATGFANDDEQECADNFTIISSGDDRVDISRSTDRPDGVPIQYSMLLESATIAANSKYGFITFAELEDAFDVAHVGTTMKVSVSFWAKVGGVAGIDQLRAAVLNLKTANPTNHPVSAWGNGSQGVLTFEATDWQLVTGGSPDGDLAVNITGAWTEFKIEGLEMDTASLGSGAMALAITVDEASIASGSQWLIAAVQFNVGDKALPYMRAPAAAEFARCLRYCETTFPDGVTPADGVGSEHALAAMSNGVDIIVHWPFAQPKHRDTGFIGYNPNRVSGNKWDDGTTGYPVSGSDANQRGGHMLGDAVGADRIHYIAIVAYANIWGTR